MEKINGETDMITVTDFSPEAVILGAGDYPRHPIPRRWLQENAHVVCCDGAADRYLAEGHTPWRIIGDGDSLSAENRHTCASLFRLYADQDTNDQTKAMNYLRKKGFGRVAIVGATGRREDHALGNISLLIDYMEQGMEARLYTDYGVFIPAQGEITVRCPVKTQVSIFNFKAAHISAEGLRYPLSDFTNWWQGTLNETIADTFTIRAEGVYMLFINYPDLPAEQTS